VTGGSLLPTTTLTGTAKEVRARAEQLVEQGVTEMVYQPAGPNIARELETMYKALAG
jgi:5,10-methylenetetrahydromethanopterin reductase